MGEYRTGWKGLVSLQPAEQHRITCRYILPAISPLSLSLTKFCLPQIYHQDKVSHDSSISGFLLDSSPHMFRIAQSPRRRSIKWLSCSLLASSTSPNFNSRVSQLAHKLRPCYGGWVGWGTLTAQSNTLIFTFGPMIVCIMRTLLNV